MVSDWTSFGFSPPSHQTWLHHRSHWVRTARDQLYFMGLGQEERKGDFLISKAFCIREGKKCDPVIVLIDREDWDEKRFDLPRGFLGGPDYSL